MFTNVLSSAKKAGSENGDVLAHEPSKRRIFS